MKAALWHVYLLECDGRAIYTGITTDVDRRVAEHAAGGGRAARFTRGRRRVRLIYSLEVGSRSLAARVEYRLRRLPRREKLTLAADGITHASLLVKLGIPV